MKRLVVIHGCCKAPQTRSMVRGESFDAAEDALGTRDNIAALYYTCALNSGLLAAGAPVVLPKDCPPATTFPDSAASIALAADVQEFLLELAQEVAEALASMRSAETTAAALMGDGFVRFIIKQFAGPDAAWYITIPALRKPVLEDLEAQLGSIAAPYVLLAHSLGSVIALEIATRNNAPRPDALVTVGSPLGWRTIRNRLPTPTTPFPRWINIYDPDDPATKWGELQPGNYPPIENVTVDNPPVDGHHDLYGYLTTSAASAALSALVQ